MRRARLLAAMAGLVLATPAAATVLVSVVPSSTSLTVGQPLSVELRASVSSVDILGWGLDVSFDNTVLSLAGAPLIDPLWTPLAAPDGDGLAGLVFPSGVNGDLLLATLSFTAIGPGAVSVVASATGGDLTEGFPLDPTGFDADVSYTSSGIVVMPESPIALLLAAAALALRRRFGPDSR